MEIAKLLEFDVRLLIQGIVFNEGIRFLVLHEDPNAEK
jgi:hypothetical protein